PHRPPDCTAQCRCLSPLERSVMRTNFIPLITFLALSAGCLAASDADAVSTTRDALTLKVPWSGRTLSGGGGRIGPRRGAHIDQFRVDGPDTAHEDKLYTQLIVTDSAAASRRLRPVCSVRIGRFDAFARVGLVRDRQPGLPRLRNSLKGWHAI